MPPKSAQTYQRDRRSADFVKDRYFFLLQRSCLPEQLDFLDLRGSQFGRAVLLSARRTELFNHVLGVLFVRAHREMGWINTNRVVAGMQNTQASRDLRAVMQDPCSPVGSKALTHDNDLPVLMTHVLRADPLPAPRPLAHVRIERAPDRAVLVPVARLRDWELFLAEMTGSKCHGF